ncbi:MAG: hypothetical protein ACC660_08860, partial [Acidimicrobiales bacterium]
MLVQDHPTVTHSPSVDGPGSCSAVQPDAGRCRLSARLRDAAAVWARSQHQLVVLAAEFADSAEWVLDGSPTPAHWLAAVA